MKNSYRFGVMTALCTALLWGGMSPLSKYIGMNGVDMTSVMCYRTVLVVAIMGVFLTVKLGAGWHRVGKKLILTYMLLGLLTVVFNATGYMLSCVHLTVPQALMLHYAYPLCTMAGSWFFTKEKPTRMQVLSGVMIIAGLYIGFIGGKSSAADGISMLGVFFAVVSLAGMAGQTLVSRRILMSGETNPMIQLFYIHLFGGLILITGKSLTRGWADLVYIDTTIFALMQYAAIGAGLLGFGFMFTALKYVSASLVSLICTLELVFGIAITSVLLGFYPTKAELIGSVVIMAAVAAATVQKKKKA